VLLGPTTGKILPFGSNPVVYNV